MHRLNFVHRQKVDLALNANKQEIDIKASRGTNEMYKVKVLKNVKWQHIIDTNEFQSCLSTFACTYTCQLTRIRIRHFGIVRSKLT